MKCPTDGATLTMSERAGVEIDYCPECRGIWLDRGELDKILDRAAAEAAATAAPAPPVSPQPVYREERRDGHHGDRRYDDRNQPYRKKRRESWLGELFD